MIPELGHFALACMIALAPGTLPILGAQRHEARLMTTAVPLARGQLVSGALGRAEQRARLRQRPGAGHPHSRPPSQGRSPRRPHPRLVRRLR